MGQELPVNEAQELEKVSQEQALIQRQLDTSRRKLRQHQMTISEYRMKQGPMGGGSMMTAGVGGPVGGPPSMGGPSGPSQGMMMGMAGPIPTSESGMSGGLQMGMGPRMPGAPMGSGVMGGPMGSGQMPPQMGGGPMPPQMGGPRAMMMPMGPAGMMHQTQMGGNQMMGMMNMPGGNGNGGPSPINRGAPSPLNGGLRGATPVTGAQQQNMDSQLQPSRSPLMSPNNGGSTGPNLQGTMSPNGEPRKVLTLITELNLFKFTIPFIFLFQQHLVNQGRPCLLCSHLLPPSLRPGRQMPINSDHQHPLSLVPTKAQVS